MKLSRLKKLFFLHLQHLPMKSTSWRPYIVKKGGVNIEDYKNTFIGENVIFDTNIPQDITIGSGTRIAVGVVILTHFKNLDGTYGRGKVNIGKDVWIGCNTTICKPVSIGDNALIGAGSIVTKDIPANEVWAGNPARFIKKHNPPESEQCIVD